MTVAHHAWQDFLDERRRETRPQGGSDAVERLHEVPARADLAQALQEEFDLELLEEAKARVRLEVSDRDWQVFHQQALAGRSGADVATDFQLSVAAVYMIRSRVQNRLQEAVAALERDVSPAS
jgi:DNA-directed RNA polymerase specialized sigma24 family protein